MSNSSQTADSYAVTLEKRLDTDYAAWSTVEFHVYDDGTDLVLFVRTSADMHVTSVISAFGTVTKMHPPATVDQVDKFTPVTFATNPDRGQLLLAIEATIRTFEKIGYQVTHRVNNWN